MTKHNDKQSVQRRDVSRFSCEHVHASSDIGGFHLLDHITDGVMLLDRQWRFRNVNRTAARLFKRPSAELIGREIWAEYPDLVGSGYERAYRQAAETGLPITVTEFYAPLDTWFEARAFPCEGGVTVLVRDVSEARAMSERLSDQAAHDALTGLINRRELLNRLSDLVDRRIASSVDLLFIDLDRFKEINDSVGHAAGDEVLRVISERLTVSIGKRAHASRIGGDEFVVFLVDATEGEAERVAKDIIVRMRERIETPCVRASVSASIGLARYPVSAANADELLRNADTAMYHAKRLGGSRVWSFGKEDAQRLSNRLRLRADLENASATGQFELYFQPQLNLVTGYFCGAEALVRWNHPELGLLAPPDFLDVLLASPVHEATGEWLIHRALRQAAQWQAAYRMRFKVAVNLSAEIIQDCNLAPMVEKAAEAAGVCPSALDIEVTEAVVVSDFLAASRSLEAVRKLGATVSLDDFGTGYSSLSYLTELPIDRIKIDKSFVQQLTGDETGRRARAMIEAMVALARALGMKTVAEGVESEEQLALVQKLGCDAAQGYFIGRPVPAAELDLTRVFAT
ncbi:response regulator receiver modulated diguanylate cyclase/phosphodiesterase [Caballeronia temeraria]|uniref:Response regulator receiver modulated diguanylate cyclase/phosphodiesterase n=1 Tax=Caballeronia temeraria TaxID=1777137 RepID=A0A158BYB2_9BURK|nr:GGDEF and EAL domain-containing protein [Caballeronia temeraria]SAK74257.1 response regulator receiver modulated diguanylate cyclase/phosphodiesterase [Caballeronia temeraria]